MIERRTSDGCRKLPDFRGINPEAATSGPGVAGERVGIVESLLFPNDFGKRFVCEVLHGRDRIGAVGAGLLESDCGGLSQPGYPAMASGGPFNAAIGEVLGASARVCQAGSYHQRARRGRAPGENGAPAGLDALPLRRLPGVGLLPGLWEAGGEALLIRKGVGLCALRGAGLSQHAGERAGPEAAEGPENHTKAGRARISDGTLSGQASWDALEDV